MHPQLPSPSEGSDEDGNVDIRAESSLSRHRLIAAHLSDAILLLDANGALVSDTLADRQMLGRDAGYPRQSDMISVVHPDDQPLIIRLLNDVLIPTPLAKASAEVRVMNADGGFVWVELHGTNLLHEPSVNAIVVAARNIHERKLMEAELLLAEQREREGSSRQRAFVNTASHELRNLVHGILGLAHALQRLEIPQEARDMTQSLLRQSGTLRRVVDDLLDEASIAAGRLRVRREPIDLAEMLSDIRMATSISESSPVTFSVSPVPSNLKMVLGDADRVRQALQNFLSNALAHTSAGTISVDVGPGRSGRVRVAVRDTGSGIDSAEVDRLFRPYERGVSRPTGRTGLGLGLAIVKASIESMGGTVGAEAHAVGSTFWFELPAALTTAEPMRLEKVEEPREPRDLHRVLVVDDDAVNLMVAKSQLHSLADELDTVPSLEEAIQKLSEQQYDLVICDLHLREGSGFDLLTHTSALGAARPPVIVMSGAVEAQLATRLLQAGADAFLAKPATVA